MNSVAYNSLPSAYGAKLDGMTLPPYNKVPSYSRTNPNFFNGIVQHPKPQSQQPLIKEEPETRGKDKNNSSVSYLQIPSSINNTKGSLAEFAAQMTCLFWFESTSKLTAIEDRASSGTSIAPEAIPSLGFQKWVSNILSTTQVSQNVILLALLFVYRLKKFNPGVRGKKGSEYRLMTIALMLGNKFLDDNTYTNKTWAEVSGISVQEIHVMEVEFLSNLRYNLYASESEWAKWHAKLGLFADFFNNAPLALEKHEAPPAPPMLHISPIMGPTARNKLSPTSLSKLPSPPAAAESLRAQHWNLPLNGSSYTNVPQLVSDVPQVTSRKRARDDSAGEHPAKKVVMPNTIPIPVSSLPTSILSTIPALPPMLAPTAAPSQQTVPSAVSRLPLPTLPPSSNTLAPSVPASVPQFPPTVGRSTIPPVYNPASWAAPIPTPTAVQSLANGLLNPAISLPDPARHHNSPFAVTSATVSPAVSVYSAHTPQTHLSPSFFLANRNSPYRPVRTVNTLLIPPPSASLQHQRTIPFDHMHYQPLGKTAAERKTGLLPYLHQEAWPQGGFHYPPFHPTPNYSG
ncbi:hypothetical protein AOCH_007200 [Aspergillus ochraceoroseus]|nr:hypothetical protein AOCH_007200 [Aspergillus ochraceoroseus]